MKDAVVEFREGALPSLDAAHDQHHVAFRLDDMTRRVEEIQRRNADLEAKLAAQNETIRDHTLVKLTHLEERLAQREDATKDETLRQLTSLQSCMQQRGDAPSRDPDLHLKIERLEQKLEAAIPNPHRARAMDTLERLERSSSLAPPTAPSPLGISTPPTALSHEIPDEWLAERARLYQLKSARDKARAA